MAIDMVSNEENITTLNFYPLYSFTHILGDYIFSFFNESLIDFWCENLNDYPVTNDGGSGPDNTEGQAS